MNTFTRADFQFLANVLRPINYIQTDYLILNDHYINQTIEQQLYSVKCNIKKLANTPDSALADAYVTYKLHNYTIVLAAFIVGQRNIQQKIARYHILNKVYEKTTNTDSISEFINKMLNKQIHLNKKLQKLQRLRDKIKAHLRPTTA